MFEFATYRELSDDKLNSLINLYNDSSDFYLKLDGLNDFYLGIKKCLKKLHL